MRDAEYIEKLESALRRLHAEALALSNHVKQQKFTHLQGGEFCEYPKYIEDTAREQIAVLR